jgi:hypothetical protein
MGSRLCAWGPSVIWLSSAKVSADDPSSTTLM